MRNKIFKDVCALVCGMQLICGIIDALCVFDLIFARLLSLSLALLERAGCTNFLECNADQVSQVMCLCAVRATVDFLANVDFGASTFSAPHFLIIIILFFCCCDLGN